MRIVILSRNPKLYSTSRLVAAAEKRGHEVMVVDHLKCNIEIEKKSPKIFYKGEYLENIDAIIPRIGASVTFYGTAVIRQFEMMKVFSAVSFSFVNVKLNFSAISFIIFAFKFGVLRAVSSVDF